MDRNSNHTLTRADYCSNEVYELERQRIFHQGWFYVGRADLLGPGGRTVVDVAGESVLVVRDLDGTLYAHANVCRHRGARLCEEGQPTGQGSIMCPYHAWTYALDGTLIGTPRVGDDEIDRGPLRLWSVAVDEWEGFVFVCLAARPAPLLQWLGTHSPDLLEFAELQPGRLRTAVRTSSTVAANWKIIVENYQECLHCPLVHPELVDLVPLYRTGLVTDPDRDDGGVVLAGNSNSFSLTGTAPLPLLPSMPEEQWNLYRGATVFPNMFVDVTGTSIIVSGLYPQGPGSTLTTMEYLFAPETIATPGFDPSSVVEFSELVGQQDYVVCETVQRGVSSRAFEHGVLTPKDDLVIAFTQQYLEARDSAG